MNLFGTQKLLFILGGQLQTMPMTDSKPKEHKVGSLQKANNVTIFSIHDCIFRIHIGDNNKSNIFFKNDFHLSGKKIVLIFI